MQRLHGQIVGQPARHVSAEHHHHAPCPHDAVGHDGSDERTGDVEHREQDEAEDEVDRRRADHEPLVLLKVAQHRAVGAEHAVVPADVLV